MMTCCYLFMTYLWPPVTFTIKCCNQSNIRIWAAYLLINKKNKITCHYSRYVMHTIMRLLQILIIRVQWCKTRKKRSSFSSRVLVFIYQDLSANGASHSTVFHIDIIYVYTCLIDITPITPVSHIPAPLRGAGQATDPGGCTSGPLCSVRFYHAAKAPSR